MSETRLRFPLRLKTLLLFILIGVVVPAISAAYLLPLYGSAVRTSEERSQQILLSRVRAEVGREVTLLRRELRLLAGAVAEAAKSDPSLGEPLLRAALASSERVDVIRFSVPDADVDTVLNKAGVDAESVPKLSASGVLQAEEKGWSYELVDQQKALLIVRVPSTSGATGFISAVHHLDQLRHSLAEIAQRDGVLGTSVGVTGADGQLIAIHRSGQKDASKSEQVAPLVFDQEAASLDVTRQFTEGGQEILGSTGRVVDLSWTVAVWRPLELALADFQRVKRLALIIYGCLLLFTIGLALWASESLTRPVLNLAAQTQKIGQRMWGQLASPDQRADEIGDLSESVYKMARELQQGEVDIKSEEKKRSDLSRFLSRPLVDDILSGKNEVKLGGHHQEVTVVFADMVAFSRAAEVHAPEQVVGLLNELFSVMTEVVFRHGGTVDKFIGDCIMGVWGAPLEQPDHAARGVRAARDMMRFLEAAAEDWYQKYGIEVRLAVGVNSGRAIVGNVGSEKRMEYTVIGDVVNVAARLEAIAAPNQVLLSEHTVNQLDEGFLTRMLGQRELSGRQKAVTVYELELA